MKLDFHMHCKAFQIIEFPKKKKTEVCVLAGVHLVKSPAIALVGMPMPAKMPNFQHEIKALPIHFGQRVV